MAEKTAKQEWHVLYAKSETLGRLSTKAASLLLGKHRLDSARNTVAPVAVVVINTDNLKVTGKKMDQKVYYRHSGYPGGLKQRTLKEQMEKDSRVVVHTAVSGMLPKNNLRARRLRNLLTYTGTDHPHKAQLS